MSEKLDKLIERAEELLAVLKLVADDMKQLVIALKPYTGQATAQETAVQETAQSVTLETVRNSFSEDLRSLLGFQENEEYVIIKPQAFLGSENFARIAEIVKKFNGEYVSAGKGSYFRVPKR